MQGMGFEHWTKKKEWKTCDDEHGPNFSEYKVHMKWII